jgi:hypothetical protein
MGLRLGQEVMLSESKYVLGKIIAFHTAIDKATVSLPSGGTVRVPVGLLVPAESPPIARKSAPRRRT